MISLEPTPTAATIRSGIRQESEIEIVGPRLNSGGFSHIWGLVLSIGLVLALAGPFLAGRIYTADDLGAFHLPMRAFYADCLNRGEPFDWSPQMYCGFYLTGEGQIGAYHPLHLLLYRTLPLPIAFDLECQLSYPFMLLGMYLLLRRWGIRRDAAVFGGLTFAFSGFSLLHFVHVNGIAVVAHIPWLLLAIHAVVQGVNRNRRLMGGVGLALLTGSQLLLGYPQYVWLSLLVELGYVTLLSRSRLPDGSCESVAADQRSRPVGETYLRALATLGIWLALGVLLGAVQLLPTIDALQHSSRQTVGRDFGGWGSLDPLNLVQFVAPYLFKTRVVGQNTHELGLYDGSVTFVLAALCLVNRPKRGRLRLLTGGAVILVIIGLLLAFGEHGPLEWIVARLPLLSSFRFPCRAIVLVHLGLAVLAAVGLVSLAPVGVPPSGGAAAGRRTKSILCALVVLSALAAIAGPMLWPDYVAAPMLVWVGPVLVSLSAILVMLTRRQAKWAYAALMLLSAIDLGIYGMSYSVYPQGETFAQYVAAVPVPPGSPPQRVALDLLGANQRGLHTGNQLLLRGFERADGYAGLEPARQLDYRQTTALRLAGVGWIAPTADATDLPSMSSVAPPGLPSGPAPATRPFEFSLQAAACRLKPGLQQAFDPALATQGSDWLRIEAPLPKARLVSTAVVSADPAHEINAIPLESTALIEQPLDLQASSPGTATILAHRPGDIRVAVEAPSRQLLVLAESFHSGWEATVDGRSRPILRVNGDFMGCVVEPGKSEIHFQFQPASLRYGRWLSILGLGLIGLAVLFAIKPSIRGLTPPAQPP